MTPPFEWDVYSDQPKIIRDKGFKRRMRMRYLPDVFKMLFTSLVVFPAGMWDMAIRSRTPRNPRPDSRPSIDFFGMGVSLEKGECQADLIEDLGVHHVLMRVPLWDLENISAYARFGETFKRNGKTVLINILQDREHIDNSTLLKSDVRTVFNEFDGIAQRFQIGNAINRLKWGFFSVQEYLRFYQTIQNVQQHHYPNIELLGPAVIDFEYHYVIRALFNHYDISFDQLSALLYVDRMGAPDAKQYHFFDTEKKIRLLAALAARSKKISHQGIIITEVNWPLRNTAPYAPTSETECVSPETYSDYMVRYHQIAANTGCVDRVYWHQLVAPGYGLVDHRNETWAKRPAYAQYKAMVADAQKSV